MSKEEAEKIPVVLAGERLPGIGIFNAAMASDLPFRLAAIATTDQDLRGKRFKDTRFVGPPELDDVPFVGVVQASEMDVPLIFSGLRSELAARYDARLARERLLVPLSVQSREADEPVVNALINNKHIDDLYEGDATGRIINSGNSLASILSVPLAPLHRDIGIVSLEVDTLQGWSDTGAYDVPVLPSDASTHTDIHPVDSSKNEGVQSDINRILGTSVDQAADIDSERMRLRHGPWNNGHYAKVTARFARDTSKQEVEDLWRRFEAPKAIEAIRPQLKVISRLGGERWPKGHQSIKPVDLEYGDNQLLRRDDKGNPYIRRMHPMRVSVHVLAFDPEDPRSLTFELTGDSLVEGSIGNGLLNALYAHAKGHLQP